MYIQSDRKDIFEDNIEGNSKFRLIVSTDVADAPGSIFGFWHRNANVNITLKFLLYCAQIFSS